MLKTSVSHNGLRIRLGECDGREVRRMKKTVVARFTGCTSSSIPLAAGL